MEKLGLFSLERWKLRGDLIEVYKIMRLMDRVDSQKLLPRVEESITRGHRFEVRGTRFKGDVRGRFFTPSSGCLELVAGGGSGSGYGSDF